MSRLVTALALVAGLATASPCLAEPKWTILHDGALTVLGDQSPSSLHEIAIQIQQFRSVVGGLIQNADRPLSVPTVVFVLGTHKAMEPLLPLYKGKPATIAGYFGQASDSNYIIMSLDGFEESSEITFHEYTHLLVRNAVKALPVWLNEGLAEYYSSYAVIDHGKAAVVGRAIKRHIILLRQRYVPIAELIAVDQSSPMYNEGERRSIFYAESWALIHYMLLVRPNGAAAINNYTSEIAAGHTPIDAFKTAFGASPADVDKELQEYLRHLTFPAIRFTFATQLAFQGPAAGRPLTAGEADAWIGDAQRRVQRAEEATPRIEKAAATEPQTAIGQLALGHLRVSQQRTPDALAAFDLAASLAPDDFLTQYVSGISRLRAAPTASTEERTKTRAALKRATLLNGASSDAYAALAYVQMLSHDLLQEARTSIEHAIALSPGRLDYRLRYADIRILQGEVEAARAVLTPIAAITTDTVASKQAQVRLDAILEHERPVTQRTDASSAEPAAAGRAATSGPAPLPSRARTTVNRGDFVMRAVRPGESQAFGTLRIVDCASGSVRFTIESDGRTVVAAAAKMEDVDLVAFLDDKDFALSCGPHVSSDRVYLTFRPDTKWASPSVGTVVALEFVPASHVP
ncbi:MAG TPA: DUF1570 domain-containing protein [Vicinamibacterales bacterium]